MSKKKLKSRLDLLMLEKGLVESRTKAQALIMAGEVLVSNNPVTKPGTLVETSLVITIKAKNPYVSRGGLKLEHALQHFNISLTGKICLDIGASTGGFTDCMLQHGAQRVYAVDVGHNQLHSSLLSNEKVVSMEGVNFRYFSCKSLKEPVEFVTIDVSFISLEKILPAVIDCLQAKGHILALVKPQFEAPPSQAKKGVVRDEGFRQKAIEKIRSFSERSGLAVLGGVDSKIKGPKGNIEHFLLLTR